VDGILVVTDATAREGLGFGTRQSPTSRRRFERDGRHGRAWGYARPEAMRPLANSTQAINAYAQEMAV